MRWPEELSSCRRWGIKVFCMVRYSIRETGWLDSEPLLPPLYLNDWKKAFKDILKVLNAMDRIDPDIRLQTSRQISNNLRDPTQSYRELRNSQLIVFRQSRIRNQKFSQVSSVQRMQRRGSSFSESHCWRKVLQINSTLIFLAVNLLARTPTQASPPTSIPSLWWRCLCCTAYTIFPAGLYRSYDLCFCCRFCCVLSVFN